MAIIKDYNSFLMVKSTCLKKAGDERKKNQWFSE
jgi:hypothetical protein